MGMSSMFGGSDAVPPRPRGRRPPAACRRLVNRLNWATRISAARESASSGESVPSVSISMVSLS